MLKVTVRQDLCVGAGLCVLSANAVFDQRDEDGIVVLLQESPPKEFTEKVLSAARKCPSLAIRVEHGPEDAAA